jgi:cellulose synthase/poly-beta-1,6-N-acetylglucosamine synthase-like glycosyltransferase
MFWVSMVLIIYTYLVFPILTMLRGRLRQQSYISTDITPATSMIIAAHNEAANIGVKLDNTLALDYPPEQLEIIIASDGSTDDTAAIVRRFSDRGVRLLDLSRQGKAAALNAAVAAASGDILVFSDANSMYDPGAIRALARPFTDPSVGGVAGNQVYRATTAATAPGGEQIYWDFDRKLKRSQSQTGNAISATGAIYAIRRTLFQPVPSDVTDDFAISTAVIAQGYRLVFAPDAIAYETAAHSNTIEFGRKARVITRGLRAVLLRRALLNPLRYRFYALQLFSHKVLRRLVVLPLILLLLLSPLIWNESFFYQAVVGAELAFYGCATIGFFLRNTRLGQLRLFSLPFFFCMVNAAALVAIGNLVLGRRIERWAPQRDAAG